MFLLLPKPGNGLSEHRLRRGARVRQALDGDLSQRARLSARGEGEYAVEDTRRAYEVEALNLRVRGRAAAADRLGADRLAGAYAWRSLIEAGAIIAGGSDAPVERGDPLIEFYAAVARRGLDGYQDENWRPEEAVTRAEALKIFTLWPAYASFQEDRLGTLEPGKRADFTVFSKDIMTVPEEEILSAKPVMTVVDGEIVFRAE